MNLKPKILCYIYFTFENFFILGDKGDRSNGNSGGVGNSMASMSFMKSPPDYEAFADRSEMSYAPVPGPPGPPVRDLIDLSGYLLIYLSSFKRDHVDHRALKVIRAKKVNR